MPSALAACRARARSREAIATTRVCWPCCMAGITFLRAMAAVLRTPQRSFLDMEIMIKPDEQKRTLPIPPLCFARLDGRLRVCYDPMQKSKFKDRAPVLPGCGHVIDPQLF